MKNFSSPVECLESGHVIFNRDYRDIFQNVGLDSFDSIYNYQDVEIIKNIRDRSVRRFNLHVDGKKKSFYLKRHNKEYVGIRWLMTALFPGAVLSQGLKEFKNICDFRRKSLATVEPVAAGERLSRLFWAESFLITEDFSPFVSLEKLIGERPQFLVDRKSGSEKRSLIHEIARYTRKMHQEGFNHCDFNATHILINREPESHRMDVALFDLQRVARIKFLRFRWVIKSLSELDYTLPDDMFNINDTINFLLSYKGKSSLNLRDRFELYWIRRKTEKIKRHTEKMLKKRQERRGRGLPER